MATIVERMQTTRDQYLQSARLQMEKWRADLKMLAAGAEKQSVEARAAYHEALANLLGLWRKMEAGFEDMEKAGSDTWEQTSAHWQQAADRFTSAFNELTRGDAPLGWVQGLSDRRIQDSEGWVEGMGERQPGSEGWAEGIGKREESSKGWAEGYKKTPQL